MGLEYDTRFDNMEVRDFLPTQCQKERLLDLIAAEVSPDEYVTLDELQEIFSISRYQIGIYLKKIGAKPFGEVKNITKEGKRTRGVGKVAYKRSVIDDVQSLVTSSIDIEAIKLAAMEALGE